MADVAQGSSVLVAVDARLVRDVVVVGDVDVRCTGCEQVRKGRPDVFLRPDDRVVVDLDEPERGARHRRVFLVRAQLAYPRGAAGDPGGEEVRPVSEQAAGHEATVGESPDVDAAGVHRVRVGLDEGVDQLLERGAVDRLVVVRDLSRSRVHPVGGAGRREHVGGTSQLGLDVGLAQGDHLVARDGAIGLAALARAMEPQHHGNLLERPRRVAEDRVGAAFVDGGDVGLEGRIAHLDAVEGPLEVEVPSVELGTDVAVAAIEHEAGKRVSRRVLGGERLELGHAEVAHPHEAARETPVDSLGEANLRQDERDVGAHRRRLARLVRDERPANRHVAPRERGRRVVVVLLRTHHLARHGIPALDEHVERPICHVVRADGGGKLEDELRDVGAGVPDGGEGPVSCHGHAPWCHQSDVLLASRLCAGAGEIAGLLP